MPVSIDNENLDDKGSLNKNNRQFHHCLLQCWVVLQNEHALCRGPQNYHHPLVVYDDEISFFFISSISPSIIPTLRQVINGFPHTASPRNLDLHNFQTMAALKNLVEAFLRWHEEEFEPSALQSNVRHAARILKLEMQEDRPVPTPAAIAFIFSLPLINPWELPEDRRECDICGEMMHVESDWSEDHRLEVAARLKCGHIIGYRCLEAWLNPLQGMNNNTVSILSELFHPLSSTCGVKISTPVFKETC